MATIYTNLDGRLVGQQECMCRDGTFRLECPVDDHKIQWLRRNPQWGERPRRASQDAEQFDLQAAEQTEMFDIEKGKELQMGKNGFIDAATLVSVLKKRIGKRTPKQAAKEFKVSYQFLYKVLAGEYEPGPTIAKSLGFEPFIGYRRRPRPKPKAKPSKPKPRGKVVGYSLGFKPKREPKPKAEPKANSEVPF